MIGAVCLVRQTTRWEPKTGTDIGGGCVAKEVCLEVVSRLTVYDEHMH